MSDADKAITVRWGGLTIPLLVLFITLKLTGEVDWHWAWVVSPAWLPLAVLLGVTLAFAIGAVICLGVAALFVAIGEVISDMRRKRT